MAAAISGAKAKKRAMKKALFFGALSAGLYAAVFTHASLIMSYFTRGGVYAIAPVATVFLFSYVHGTLASNVWTALGIMPSRQVEEKRVEKPVTVPARAERPRVYASPPQA